MAGVEQSLPPSEPAGATDTARAADADREAVAERLRIAAETPDPGAPTVIVTGHPVMGHIRIRQRDKR